MVGFPELVYSSPINGQTDVQLSTTITLDWSTDIDLSQVTDANTLAQKIVLLNELTNAIVPLTYTSYTARSRRLVLTPSTALAGSTNYRLLVRAGFKDSAGRKTLQEYALVFKTLAAGFSPVTLLEPADGSVFTSTPYTFTWTASIPTTGTIAGLGYDVSFFEDGLSVGTFTTAATSLILTTGSYETVLGSVLGRSFSWQVTARTGVGVTGTPVYAAPSAQRSIHFSSPTVAADPSSARSYVWDDKYATIPMYVDAVTPENLATNLNTYGTMTLLFSQPIATGTAGSYLSITRKDQLPRNDIPNSYLEFDVSGSWTFSGRTATFTLGETGYNNTRYTIKALPGLTATNGQVLEKLFTSSFSSKYSPYYVDIRMIKAKLRSEANTMPDDLINYYIFLKSLEANTLYNAWLLQLPTQAAYADTLTETYIRTNTNLRGHGVLRWVEAATLYEIYSSILVDEIRNVGRKRRLGDYEESLSSSFLEGIKDAQKKALDEMEYWKAFLIPGGVVGGGVYTNSRMVDVDFDYMNRRDLGLDRSEYGRGLTI
jgi:mRNA-degrading endonuclease toxin of MazEF toxin-antitoxin module